MNRYKAYAHFSAALSLAQQTLVCTVNQLVGRTVTADVYANSPNDVEKFAISNEI